MLTLLIAPLIGIASALLAIVLTPTLQHYFWRRQRHAERQLAIIEEVNTLAAGLHAFQVIQGDPDLDRREQFYVRVVKVRNNVTGLFSDQAVQRFMRLDQALCQALFLPEICTFE